MVGFLPRHPALVAKHTDVAKAAVLLQVRKAGDECPHHLRHVFIAELRQPQVVVGAFDHDFVRSQVAHLVINALGAPLRIAFNAIERTQMGGDTHIPPPVAVDVRIDGLRGQNFLAGAEGTDFEVRPCGFAVFLDHPIHGDGVFPNLHQSSNPLPRAMWHAAGLYLWVRAFSVRERHGKAELPQ